MLSTHGHPGRSFGRASRAGDQGVARLGRMGRDQRERIARTSGCAHNDAASLVDHLSKREVAQRLLEALSPDGLLAARLFVEASDLLPRRAADMEMRSRLGDRAEKAMRELESLELLLEAKWAGGARLVGLLPPLARSMRPYLWLLGDVRDEYPKLVSAHASRASIGLADLRRLLLALAAVATESPRMSSSGVVHGYDLVKVQQEKLEPFFEDSSELESLVGRLWRLGLLLRDEKDKASIFWSRAEEIFASHPTSRLSILLSADGEPKNAPPSPGMTTGNRVVRMLYGGLATLPKGSWARISALEDAIRVRILAADNQSPYIDLKKAAWRARAHVRWIARALLPCLDVHREEREVWVRLPGSEPFDDRAQWLIQPDHEIIVPPEIPPLDFVRLASVSSIVRADVVSLFQVSPESVARATRCGLDAGEIRKRLASRASGDLPEGLGLQVEDWARQASRRLGEIGGGQERGGSSSSSRIDLVGGGRSPTSLAPHRQPPLAPLPSGPRREWKPAIRNFRRKATRSLEEGRATEARETPE